MYLTPLEEQFTRLAKSKMSSDDLWLTHEVLVLLLQGAARRGYYDPQDYLVALVEADDPNKK
jgi:hypothetical protein